MYASHGNLGQLLAGTATTSDSDYVAKTGTLAFAPGETTKIITIEVIGDNKREASTCSTSAATRCLPKIATCKAAGEARLRE